MNSSLRVFSAKVNKTCRYIPSFTQLFEEENPDPTGCLWTNDYYDVTETIMKQPNNGKKLVRMGLFDSIPSNDEVSHFMSILFFQLNDVLHNQAEASFSRYPRPILGLQIRTGGSSSNTPERIVFNTLDNVDSILSFVDIYTANKTLLNPTLFLSSDSNAMVEAIRSKSKYTVLTLDAYTIGHSSPKRNKNTTSSSLKRAVMDIYILSKCDYLITSANSSFGLTSHFLSSSTHKEFI